MARNDSLAYGDRGVESGHPGGVQGACCAPPHGLAITVQQDAAGGLGGRSQGHDESCPYNRFVNPPFCRVGPRLFNPVGLNFETPTVFRAHAMRPYIESRCRCSRMLPGVFGRVPHLPSFPPPRMGDQRGLKTSRKTVAVGFASLPATQLDSHGSGNDKTEEASCPGLGYPQFRNALLYPGNWPIISASPERSRSS